MKRNGKQRDSPHNQLQKLPPSPRPLIKEEISISLRALSVFSKLLSVEARIATTEEIVAIFLSGGELFPRIMSGSLIERRRDGSAQSNGMKRVLRGFGHDGFALNRISTGRKFPEADLTGRLEQHVIAQRPSGEKRD